MPPQAGLTSGASSKLLIHYFALKWHGQWFLCIATYNKSAIAWPCAHAPSRVQKRIEVVPETAFRAGQLVQNSTTAGQSHIGSPKRPRVPYQDRHSLLHAASHSQNLQYHMLIVLIVVNRLTSFLFFKHNIALYCFPLVVQDKTASLCLLFPFATICHAVCSWSSVESQELIIEFVFSFCIMHPYASVHFLAGTSWGILRLHLSLWP